MLYRYYHHSINIYVFIKQLFAAVNLGYAIVGILGTIVVRKLGRDWLSYIIAAAAGLWYFLWWRFVEYTLNPNRLKRDVNTPSLNFVFYY